MLRLSCDSVTCTGAPETVSVIRPVRPFDVVTVITAVPAS